MTSVSIIKIVASASLVIAATGTAVVVGVPQVHQQVRLAADAVTATISPQQAAPAVRSDAPPTVTETPPARAATQAPTALAAIGANSAALPAEPGKPQAAASKDQPSPSFDVVRVEADGEAVVAGRAAPGATVDLLRGSERLDRAVANDSGEFTMVPPRLPAGSYELTLSASLPNGTVASSKQSVAVTVNEAGPMARAAQSRAEYVPETTASQPRPPSEPRSQAAKPQESAGVASAPTIHVSSASDEAASPPPAGHAMSSKVVVHGDSLWRISRFIYGDGARYALVFRANRGRIQNPNLIYPGQTLVLPAHRN